jgi:hypothetical protein
MAGFFKGKSSREQRELRLRFGFIEVKPALNPNGEEMFGLVELAPEYGAELFRVAKRRQNKQKRFFSAALRLTGPELNLFLADDKREQQFWSSLSEALPTDVPSQILLRRRRGSLATHYQAWQDKIQRRLTDPEVAYSFLQDYLENLVYPVEESGLTESWAGIFVSGSNEEEVAARLALIMSKLPCEAAPCTSAELSWLLLDYYAPQLIEQILDNNESADQLFVRWLSESLPVIDETAIYSGEQLTHFWTLAAPPSTIEGGWTRPLLESETLADSEYDVVVHLAPAPVDPKLFEVLNRRVATLEKMLEKARSEGNRGAVRELAEQRNEIESRLNAMSEGSEHYFEIGISLALRTSVEQPQQSKVFEDELNALGFAPRPVEGYEEIERALLNCAPLNLGYLSRSFVLPSSATGRLAHITSEGGFNHDSAGPLAGISPTGHPLYFNPATRPGESAMFFLGEPGKASGPSARAFAQYLTAMRYLEGSNIFGFDLSGEWSATVRQLGGEYLGFGPDYYGTFGWNPLYISPDRLNDLKALEYWVRDTATYLDKLLELNPLEQQDLNALLLECAIQASEQKLTIDAEMLYQRAHKGGYRLLAERLDEITSGGMYDWLFANPTRLPEPGTNSGMLFVGFSAQGLKELNQETRRFYLNRFFTAWVAKLSNSQTQPQLIILDEAQELLTTPQAAATLVWLKQNAARLGVSLWALSPRTDEWLVSNAGQKFLDSATWQFFFNQSSPGLAGMARRFALPQRAVKTIRELGMGSALIRHSSGALSELLPLPGDYISRLIPARVQKQLSAKTYKPLAGSTAPATANPSPATGTRSGGLRPNVPEPVAETEQTKTAASATKDQSDPVFIFAKARGA